MNVFSAVLEGCQWIIDTLVHARQASTRSEQNYFAEEDWAQAEKDFSQMIRQVLVAYESRDYILVADLLEYELTTCLDRWNNLINGVSALQPDPSAESTSENTQVENEDQAFVEPGRVDAAGLRVQSPMGGR